MSKREPRPRSPSGAYASWAKVRRAAEGQAERTAAEAAEGDHSAQPAEDAIPAGGAERTATEDAPQANVSEGSEHTGRDTADQARETPRGATREGQGHEDVAVEHGERSGERTRPENEGTTRSPSSWSSSWPPQDAGSAHSHESSSPSRDDAEGSGPGSFGEDPSRDKRRLERAVRESLRWALSRGLERGVETFSRTDKAIRSVVDDVKLPKELTSYLLSQVEDTRERVVGLAAKEVRTFLERTDLAAEMKRVLTSLSFEIRTEVRFIPNDAGGVKPDVRASVSPKVERKTGERSDARDHD